MGGGGDREDWVADIPFGCISVHDYQWNGDSFGANHGSFNNAVIEETEAGIQLLRFARQARLGEIRKIEDALKILDKTAVIK